MSIHPFHSDRPRGYFLGAGILIAIGLVIGLGLSATLDLQKHSTAQKTSSKPPASATINPGAMGESPFVAVVEQALPAVVFIDVRKTAGSDDASDDLFRRFFGQDAPRRPQNQPSSGSGFIIDDSGYILTNNHVVRDASDITVTLNDRRSFKARVVGSDPETDVAVIKVEAANLPLLELGDSDHIRVGDWAIAIGNPLGMLRGSVTVGIISARGRSDLNIFGGSPVFQDFIQTDASINFGNSGGPLCNIRGQVIGINTAINPSGQGIGFAIPINLAKNVADQLIAHGSVKRAMLGVYLADLTPELAEGFGIKGQRGVLIQTVMDDSPAAKAGLRRNDVVVEFDGQPVTELQKFRLKVADTPTSRKIPVTVLRDGKRMNFEVLLTNRETVLASNEPVPGAPAQENVAGIEVRSITDEERAAASIKAGVVVTSIVAGSPAEDAGVEPGDIIEEVSGKAVNTPAEFAKTLGKAKTDRKHAVLLVNNGNGQSRFVALQISE